MPLPDVPKWGNDLANSKHERLLAALKASRAGTWRWKIAEDVVEWDDALCEVYGIARERAPRNSREFLELIHPDDREMAWRNVSQCIETGTDADYQFRTVVSGQVRWIYDRSAVIKNPDDSPAYMLGACLDVTAQRRVQEERDTALKQQTLLLNELSHRVKNHLAMIIGVLRLKGGRQKDPQAKEDFARAIDRITTIAHLHEQLYRAEDITSVDVQTYVDKICNTLEQSLLMEANIVIQRELEPAALHIDKAVPVGLIVNELVTNAIKYAFKAGDQGCVVVRFRMRGKHASLTISDNGRGLVGTNTRQGVGTRLVRDLAKQIGATVRVIRRPSCAYSFRFKIARDQEASRAAS